MLTAAANWKHLNQVTLIKPGCLTLIFRCSIALHVLSDRAQSVVPGLIPGDNCQLYILDRRYIFSDFIQSYYAVKHLPISNNYLNQSNPYKNYLIIQIFNLYTNYFIEHNNLLGISHIDRCHT